MAMYNAYRVFMKQTTATPPEIIPWRGRQEQRFLQVGNWMAAPRYAHRATSREKIPGLLDTLSLRTLRGFQRIEALGRGLYITLHMGGKIAPSEDPFGCWISVELAISALRILHDIPTAFAALDNGMTGSSVEATARLFHKETVRTRFDCDTFHRFALPFYV